LNEWPHWQSLLAIDHCLFIVKQFSNTPFVDPVMPFVGARFAGRNLSAADRTGHDMARGRA
jgi:hypothetical protein